MNGRLFSLALFLLAFCGMTRDAQGGIPIPIVWGQGEKMTELGELPPEVSRQVAEELGTKVTVAFLHQRAHVFYLDVWTWNGRYVLHAGDTYWEPDSTGWEMMIGGTPSAKYGTPILYRVPLLPALLILAFVGFWVRARFFKTELEKLQALMNDKRYQRALETIFGQSGDEEAETAITTLDERKLLTAKDQLIVEGIDAFTAEANLRKLADAILADTNQKLDAYLGLAADLDHQGEWDESAKVYSQIISSLPDDDERLDYARNCLAAVNEKRGESAAEEGERGKTRASDEREWQGLGE